MVNLLRRTLVNIKRRELVNLTGKSNCYASTLKRQGVPREFIGDMLGHNDPRTTSHYLDSLSIDETFNINNKLVKKKKKEIDVGLEVVI